MHGIQERHEVFMGVFLTSKAEAAQALFQELVPELQTVVTASHTTVTGLVINTGTRTQERRQGLVPVGEHVSVTMTLACPCCKPQGLRI